jgi:pimeloyl-ACP methyl ester carboxylesterase
VLNLKTPLAGNAGLAIAALVEGPAGGLPVLLAHGGGQTKRTWKRISALLGAHGFRAFALDLRGHGDSAWADDGAYDVIDFARDLIAIAGSFEHKPALIGASLGGLAGIMAEGKVSPGSFASLTLVDVAPHMEEDGVTRIVSFMAAHAREGFTSPEEAARVISEYLPHRPSRKDSSGLAHYLRQKPDGRYYWHWDPAFIESVIRRRAEGEDASNVAQAELTDAASRLTLPVHLIRGGSSDLVSPQSVAHFRQLVPHADYNDIADATHMVVGDQNDAFGDAILDFLLRTHGQGIAA